MKKLMRQQLVLLAVALVAGLSLTACKQGGQKAMKMPPADVDVVTVKTEPIDLKVELPGRTVPYRIAEVRPQVGGIIQKRLFTEGGEVKAGQVLYQIDPAIFQATFDSAKANLAKAEATEKSARIKADSYRILVKTKAVSDLDQVQMEAAWKQAVADVAAAKAALESARINLDYTKVTAPISGRIGKSSVTEGALVTAQQGTALATIQQLNPIYVDVNQASSEMLQLKKEVLAGKALDVEQPKSPVAVVLDDGSVYGQQGTLQFSDVTVNQNTGTVTLRAIINNPKDELLPGMFVRARVDTGIQPAAILIPASSVLHDEKGATYVLVANKDSISEVHPIRTGQNVGDRIVVTQGLQPGDRVITDGFQKFRPGAPVIVKGAAAPAAAPTAAPASSTAKPAKAE